jgi:hypothetical protein
MMRYDTLLVDVANFAYRTFDHRKERVSYVSKKSIYKQAVCNFITALREIEDTHLHSDGEVFLLFDNPTSRIDLQSSFYFADRKQAYAKYKKDRAKETKEFYNSISLLKYYYTVESSRYHTTQISRLEADDLVEPVLKKFCKDKRVLLISNDLDWARYLNESVHWMPRGGEVETAEDLSAKLGFKLTETNLCMYKAIFGDPADNIPGITSSRMLPYFIALTEDRDLAPTSLPLFACEKDMLERYPILQSIRESEKQYRINLQLVNAIPVAEKHLEYTTTTGRNSAVSLKALREALGLIQDKSGFVFGNIKRPRA